MATGIRDKVAILGMGCARFGERWDAGADELMVEAYLEALADAAIDVKQIGAAWFSSTLEPLTTGGSGIPLSRALRLPNIPVTHVDNYCASGTEAFRGAVYAVASGACDIALAVGMEKLKDTGFGGLPPVGLGVFNELTSAPITAPGLFAAVAGAYCAKHGVQPQDLKHALAHVSVKSHANGVKSPKAHLRKAVSMETVLNAPMIANPLGLYDCCGVSDGAACAIVTTPEIARSLGKRDPVVVKALAMSATNGWEAEGSGWDGTYFKQTRLAAQRAYAEAGITNPRAELSMLEVHDCFSITELVTMEDLGISREGGAIKDVLDGFFDADGALPCQIDGGLKCFGHPIGASGLRMLYEAYLQLSHRAGERQLADPRLALTHNLGGPPNSNVAAIAILGMLR